MAGIMIIQSGDSNPEDIASLISILAMDRGDNLCLCFEIHEHDTSKCSFLHPSELGVIETRNRNFEKFLKVRNRNQWNKTHST